MTEAEIEAPRKRPKLEENALNEGYHEKPKYDWYFTLESESPVPTDEDDESIYSVQGKETDFARDTSDTSTNVWSESDVSGLKEFEVDSRSENEASFIRMSSSSEPENTLAVEFIAFCESEGLADDSDTSKSSADNEIKNAHFLTCVQCNNPNNNPLFRYCQQCYQIKKTQFSRNRPKRKPRAPNDPRDDSMADAKITEVTVLVEEELSQADSGLPLSQDLEEQIPNAEGSYISASTSASSSQTSGGGLSQSPWKGRSHTDLSLKDTDYDRCPSSPESDGSDLSYAGRKTNRNMVASSPKSILSKNRQSDRGEESTAPTSETENTSQSYIPDNMCVICTVQPKNGAFMHGKNMHICCCYRCAVKVCKTNKNRCPICNRKVTQVLKAFYG